MNRLIIPGLAAIGILGGGAGVGIWQATNGEDVGEKVVSEAPCSGEECAGWFIDDANIVALQAGCEMMPWGAECFETTSLWHEESAVALEGMGQPVLAFNQGCTPPAQGTTVPHVQGCTYATGDGSRARR